MSKLHPHFIITDSKTFAKKLPELGFAADDVAVVVVSLSVGTENTYPNVKSIDMLVPTNKMVLEYDAGRIGNYRDQYLSLLQLPAINGALAVLMKSIVVDNRSLIFVCSPSEYEFGYLGIIAEYFDVIYGYQGYTLDEYVKAVKKDKLKPVDKKDLAEKINAQLTKVKKADPDADAIIDTVINGPKKSKKDKKKKDKKKKKNK